MNAPAPTEPLKLWSVTTLTKIGLGTSDPLVNWAVKTTAEAAIDSRATLTTMLKNEGRDAAVRWLSGRRWEKTGRAQLRGTDLHKHFEAVALGQTPPPPPEGGKPYLEHWHRWLEHFQPAFVMAEAPVYNLTERYAGTLDGIIELGGLKLLLDYKTTEHPPEKDNRPPYPEVALQLVAYRRAEQLGVISERRYSAGKRYYIYNPDNRHEPMPEVDGALCVVVSPHDCVAYPVAVDDRVWAAFLYVKENARWQLVTSQDVIGPALTPHTHAEEATF